jgi:hypothetical protein
MTFINIGPIKYTHYLFTIMDRNHKGTFTFDVSLFPFIILIKMNFLLGLYSNIICSMSWNTRWKITMDVSFVWYQWRRTINPRSISIVQKILMKMTHRFILECLWNYFFILWSSRTVCTTSCRRKWNSTTCRWDIRGIYWEYRKGLTYLCVMLISSFFFSVLIRCKLNK